MTASRPTIIKQRDVRLETRVLHGQAPSRVELLEEGGVVHALAITCSCGKTTVVELEYEPRSPR